MPRSRPHHVTRRDLLLASGLALMASGAMTGCELLSTEPAGRPSSRAPRGPKGKEAPMLAAKVKAGELPPVEERVPKDPYVVQPNETVGVYGGALRLRLPGDAYSNAAAIYSTAGYEHLVRWDVEFKEIIPNLAREYRASADSTEYTFVLREGIRWSDGEPFTAEDIVFAVEDVMMNEELHPSPPFGRMRAEAPDEHTVVLTFAEPYGLFLHYLATRQGSWFTDYPKHYLSRFHPRYNPDHATAAREAGFDEWTAVFHDISSSWSFGRTVGKPTLNPWLLTTASDNATRVVLERNPYYWKVDPEGSQLPYVDRLDYEVIKEDEAALLKILNGEIDWATHQLKDKPVVARNRERGDYRLFDVVPEAMNVVCIYPNLTHEDPVKRRILSNRNVRIGLSHAINRQEIIDAVFQRQGQAWQVAPRRESTFFDEEMATQYVEYDVDRANEFLDRAFPDKDRDGIRLGPDGKPISLIIDVANIIPTWPDIMSLVARYWRAVGIDARLNTANPELIVERGQANKHDVSVWAGEGGLDAVILLNPYNYLPLLNPYSYFAVRWVEWYQSDGKEGETPPPPVRRQMELYDQVRATADSETQVRLMKEVLRIAKEQFHAIGVSILQDEYGTVTNRIGNWPKFTTQGAWVYCPVAPTNPCQYFIKD